MGKSGRFGEKSAGADRSLSESRQTDTYKGVIDLEGIVKKETICHYTSNATFITTLIVDLAPPEARFLDFGHVDIFQATDAPGLVWEPILSWIEAHTKIHGREHVPAVHGE